MIVLRSLQGKRFNATDVSPWYGVYVDLHEVHRSQIRYYGHIIDRSSRLAPLTTRKITGFNRNS